MQTPKLSAAPTAETLDFIHLSNVYANTLLAVIIHTRLLCSLHHDLAYYIQSKHEIIFLGNYIIYLHKLNF